MIIEFKYPLPHHRNTLPVLAVVSLAGISRLRSYLVPSIITILLPDIPHIPHLPF